jgi:hypothetical protein
MNIYVNNLLASYTKFQFFFWQLLSPVKDNFEHK